MDDKELFAALAAELNEKEDAIDILDKTGLVKEDNTIEMQDGNVYVVLSSDEDGEGGLSILTSDGGKEYLVQLAFGILQMVDKNQDMLMEAGFRFLSRYEDVDDNEPPQGAA
ncbi:MAG TPA: hypothetical protein DHN29_16005 [Cytophagales bacterium]|nr:hypothetical protein [Cytophagales bacterium]|tara:strand:+ start:1658 stop:1993 length:336 start_codon:yes stop_codon:yes gene_type:complete